MNLTYPAIIHSEEDGFWVEFPDLKGCNSEGETIEETIKNAKEALDGYCISVIEHGQKLNPPSDIREISTGENSFTTFVVGDIKSYLNKGKAVKKTLTIPSWLNDLAVENNVNFSGVLQNALIEYLHIEA